MAILKSFKKGDVIFKEGDRESCMYFIAGPLEAKVAVYSGYETESQKLLSTLYVDEVFGEIAVFENNIRTGTAVAKSDVDLEVIDGEEFLTYVEKNKARCFSIVKNATKHLRDLTKDYMDACRTIASYVSYKDKGEEVPEFVIDHMSKFIN